MNSRHATNLVYSRLSPAKKALRRSFEQTAQACGSWTEYRRRVARLIDHADRTGPRASNWKGRTWRLAGVAWNQAHPD